MIPMASRGKRVAALVADAALSVIAPLLVTHRAPRSARPRVLVVRCDHLGDGILATSVLQPLRDALDPERLDVLASPWNAAVFEQHSTVDDVLVAALPWWLAARGASIGERVVAWTRLPHTISTIRERRYDIAIDLRGDLRQILFFLAFGGAAERVSSDRTGGVALLTRVAKYRDRVHQVESSASIAELLGARAPWRLQVQSDEPSPDVEPPFVVFGLSTNKPNRRWPAERAALLAQRLHRELGVHVVYVGGVMDRADGDALARGAGACVTNLAGTTSLGESFALMRRAQAFLTIDSGQLHLGAAAGCPTVALYADSDPVVFAPWGTPHTIVSAGAPCGCAQPSCRFTVGPGRCMREISVDQVFDAMLALMGS